MIRVVGFFAVGILLGVYQPDAISTKTASYLLLILVAAYFIVYSVRKEKLTLGILGLLSLFLTGFIHVSLFKTSGRPDHLLAHMGEVHAYQAMISDLAEERENSIKYELQLLRIYDGQNWQEVEGRVLFYVGKHANAPDYFYGDVLIVQGAPSELYSPANPFEFDYKRFLSFNNIYHQHFINSTKKLVLQQRESKRDILFYSYKARLWAKDQLLTFIPGIKEQAIAMALVLGVKDGIDNELQRAYASSGAMHVLAVSGLHVGIIYGLILLLFKPIQHKAGARWIVAATSIILLWIYAFITGLSPSVLRAVTMFSFIAIARPFGRATNIYNTLAGSAFLLLIINPFLIMSVGFQLSYLAVLGIVTIHRPLYMLIEPRHRILDWVWNISCVSIAAQLATFSLGILYFHQFPTYFLVSNLFVIPGAIVILIGGVVLLAVSAFTPVALLVGKLLQYFIHILNEIVFAVEGLPFSLIEHIYLTTFQCWLLIGILVAIILLLQFKQFAALVGCALLALVFSLSQWLHFHTEVKGDRLIVYNIPGHTVIEWMSNGSSTFISDAGLISDAERIRFHITPNRLHRGVSKVEIKVPDQTVSQGVKVWDYRGNIIGIVSAPVTSWPEELALDYLIVSNNAFKSFKEASSLINFKVMILDSSNKSWLASKFLEPALSEIVYSVAERGAFEINL